MKKEKRPGIPGAARKYRWKPGFSAPAPLSQRVMTKGSRRCAGNCGRTVSANAEACRACMERFAAERLVETRR